MAFYAGVECLMSLQIRRKKKGLFYVFAGISHRNKISKFFTVKMLAGRVILTEELIHMVVGDDPSLLRGFSLPSKVSKYRFLPLTLLGVLASWATGCEGVLLRELTTRNARACGESNSPLRLSIKLAFHQRTMANPGRKQSS